MLETSRPRKGTETNSCSAMYTARIVRNIKAPEGDGNTTNTMLLDIGADTVRNIKAPEGDGNHFISPFLLKEYNLR